MHNLILQQLNYKFNAYGFLQEIERNQKNLENLDLEEINRELLLITNNTTDELETPIVKNLNGFTFDVMTDNSNPVGTLKRRFAIAKNKRGVIQLRGESSFSASDQVLIDELIFYIQQNDLKAF